MPEYLAPGVFVEEVSFRSKSIEGVSTSTTGFVGLAHYGPVCYPGGPRNCEPRLITSFVEFERVYGGLTPLQVGAADPGEDRLPYLGHAARAFFDNGGKRLYVSRAFAPRGAVGAEDWGVAFRDVPVAGTNATWRARWPGRAGNVRVTTAVMRSKNAAVENAGVVTVPRARAGTVVEVLAGAAATNPPVGNDPLDVNTLRVAREGAGGALEYVDQTGTAVGLNPGEVVQVVELRVQVRSSAERVDEYAELAASPLAKRSLARILQLDDPQDEDAVVWLDFDETAATIPAAELPFIPALLSVALQGDTDGLLAGGHDGLLPTAADLRGRAADPDDPTRKATGLEALGEVDDIAIVASPDASTLGSDDDIRTATGDLINHAETLRYRIAIVDGPEASSLNEIRTFRGQFDSYRAALYHPWIEILDPTERAAQGAPPRRLLLPPSGFVAGIYARSDIARGVHKAPANEVVRGLTRFEANINKPRQEVLNPEGINALRFFEGRGHRVWGARTMSSDPEWKYVNVTRLFLFIEHSIDKGTQWAVFEPNNRRLWDNVRRTIEDFLLNLWRDGALLGDKPEQAFFVRCDRTTMTQNDLDNGRLICLVGLAPTKPAEFVIFRIGQWTAEAKQA